MILHQLNQGGYQSKSEDKINETPKKIKLLQKQAQNQQRLSHLQELHARHKSLAAQVFTN